MTNEKKMDKTGFCLLSPQPGLNSRINTCTTCARPLTGHAHHLKVYLRCGKSASFFSCADTPKQIEAVQYRTVSIINGIFARRPCCTQTTIEIQQKNLKRVILQRAGNVAHRICTSLYILLCETCSALCLFHRFVRKSRIVSSCIQAGCPRSLHVFVRKSRIISSLIQAGCLRGTWRPTSADVQV